MIDRVLYRLTPAFGALGILLILIAVGAWLVTGAFDQTVIAPAVAGLGLVAFYVLERPRQMMDFLAGRQFRYGTNTVALVMIFLVILAFINVLANRYSFRLDLTANRAFSLSDQTFAVLKQLDRPVHVIGFFREGQGKERLQDLLKEYQRQSGLVTYEFVDPYFKPGLARQYGIDQANTTIVESGDKRQTILTADEGELTSAILKLSRAGVKQVYWIVGHSEVDPGSAEPLGASEAKRMIESSNFKVTMLNLAATGKVPAEADMVLLVAPSTDLLEPEKSALIDYVRAGGRLLLLLQPDRLNRVSFLLDELGLQDKAGVVVDPAQNLMGDPLSPVITHYQDSPITKNLPMTLMQTAAQVAPKTGTSGGYSAVVVAESTANSWLETNDKEIRFDTNQDVPGPIPVVVSVTSIPKPDQQPNVGKTAQVVVIGDADFMTNNMIALVGNRDLLLNTINWLGEEQELLGLRAKPTVPSPLVISNTQLNLLLLLSVVVAPAAVLVAGAFVVWGRR